MAHLVGERLRCDACGAEIVFAKSCPCPDEQPKRHMDMCCGKEMRNLGVEQSQVAQPGAGH